MFQIHPQHPGDTAEIESFLDAVMGPARHRKNSYRYRRGVADVTELALLARDGDRLLGTIRYWPVNVGGAWALLLGPLGVVPRARGHGIGETLMRTSLETARASGHRLVCLVGDTAYYRRFGFSAGAAMGVAMPGETDRFQALDLAQGTMPAIRGVLLPASAPCPPRRTGRAPGLAGGEPIGGRVDRLEARRA